MNKNIIETDSLTAEYIKYMNNTFFASKVSIMNEFYRLANHLGVDWETALYGFVSDQRIGERFLRAGPAYGGSCFPKDTRAVLDTAKTFKVELSIIKSVIKSNDNRKLLLTKKVAI